MQVIVREIHLDHDGLMRSRAYHGKLQDPRDNVQEALINVAVSKDLGPAGDSTFDPPRLMSFNPHALTFQSVEYDPVG